MFIFPVPMLLWALQPLSALIGGIIAFRGLRSGHDPVLVRAAKMIVAIPPLLAVTSGLLLTGGQDLDMLFSFPTICSVAAMASIVAGERYRLRVGPPDDGSVRLK